MVWVPKPDGLDSAIHGLGGVTLALHVHPAATLIATEAVPPEPGIAGGLFDTVGAQGPPASCCTERLLLPTVTRLLRAWLVRFVCTLTVNCPLPALAVALPALNQESVEMGVHAHPGWVVTVMTTPVEPAVATKVFGEMV